MAVTAEDLGVIVMVVVALETEQSAQDEIVESGLVVVVEMVEVQRMVVLDELFFLVVVVQMMESLVFLVWYLEMCQDW